MTEMQRWYWINRLLNKRFKNDKYVRCVAPRGKHRITRYEGSGELPKCHLICFDNSQSTKLNQLMRMSPFCYWVRQGDCWVPYEKTALQVFAEMFDRFPIQEAA